jgi:hypothetical protein
MKILSTLAVICLLICSNICTAQDTEVTYNFSTSKSLIKWTTKDADMEYSGSMKLKSGYVVMKGEEIKTAVIFIDTKSIKCGKCGGEIQGKELISFIKSSSFLNAVNMDYAAFKMSEAKALDKKSKEGNYLLKGSLSIIAFSNNVSFPIDLEIKKGKLIVDGNMSINRDLWNLRNPVEKDGTAYSMESKIILSFTLESE